MTKKPTVTLEKMEPESDQPKEHKLPAGFDMNQVSTAISALLKPKSQDQIDLFPESTSKIHLEITAFKIPSGDHHFYPIVLPNSPYPVLADLDILLVIPDDHHKEGAEDEKLEPEMVVNNMKDKLAESITLPNFKIREVLTLRQLRDEYSTYEAKRALAKRIDVILADSRVFKNLSGILGREFYRKKKYWLIVDLEETEGWNEKFESVLKKTVLNLSTGGPTSTVVVGHTGLSPAQIQDNISKIVNWIMRKYPGGWENISKLGLVVAGSSPRIPPLVLYLGQGSRNTVIKSISRGKRLPEPVEDELSTLPGRKVRVHPKGEIEVIRLQGDELSDEETVKELGVDQEAEESVADPPTAKKSKKTKKAKKVDVEMEAEVELDTEEPISIAVAAGKRKRKSKSGSGSKKLVAVV